ncbi:hypothetical protein [Streptomyces anulatus]|uniref:hypothetical protein n=1 Tax=Streptomyces anulatus TaxID=1892 RepID=UPI00386A158A
MPPSSVIGGYMVFCSLGSALGAAATTAIFTTYGWTGSSILGSGFAARALVVWLIARRPTGTGRKESAVELPAYAGSGTCSGRRADG